MTFENLQNLISQGEGKLLDFKFAVNDTRKIAVAICAFANTDGGTLLIGVKDNGKIAGVNAQEEYFMIETAAQMRCRPQINFYTSTIDTPSGTVLKVDIPEGKSKPYAAQDATGNYKVYVRVNDENVLCDRVTRVSLKNCRSNKGVRIKYSQKEDFVLKFLAEKGAVSVNDVIEYLDIDKFDAENILIGLMSSKIIKTDYLGRFTMNDK